MKLVMLPPHTPITRGWAARLAATFPDIRVHVAEGMQQAQHDIVDADAVFGTLTPDLLARATKLRWLQAPQAAPPKTQDQVPAATRENLALPPPPRDRFSFAPVDEGFLRFDHKAGDVALCKPQSSVDQRSNDSALIR